MSSKTGELEFIAIDQPIVQRRAKQAVRGKNSMKRRRKKRRSAIRRTLLAAAVILCGIATVPKAGTLVKSFWQINDRHALYQQLQADDCPKELLELLEKNEETLDFVQNYADRETYKNQPVDLSGDCVSGKVPLLMQWDKRWGYNLYGDGMIALEGCGPVCMTMAYLHFTKDTEMNPRKMAEFAYEQGYYTSEGTSWSFWSQGAAQLGLSGQELSLSENVMKETLDRGGLIVCSMRPGDFTTTGHFILIRGYDEHGFFVNDPNRRSNSGKQWDYDALSGQIKNLWGLHYEA